MKALLTTFSKHRELVCEQAIEAGCCVSDYERKPIATVSNTSATWTGKKYRSQYLSILKSEIRFVPADLGKVQTTLSFKIGK
jgi:hypothetical protein